MSTVVEPAMGDIWFSRDPRDGRKSVKVVGLTPTHILIRHVSVTRVRRDRMNISYRFERRGTLLPTEVISVVNTGDNPFDVVEGQVWRSNDSRQARDITVLEVVIDDGYALVQSSVGAKTTRVRLDRFRPGSTGYTLLSSKELLHR